MKTRISMMNTFYNQYDEDIRLTNSRQGQMEFLVTMNYLEKYLNKNSTVLEIGAGTGRLSIALAKEGHQVTALELVKNNLDKLQEKSIGINNLQSVQGDAIDLSQFADNTFDSTLVFGPLYHLYESDDINKCIDEAIRVTKPDGVIMFSFISIYGIMFTNYLKNNWTIGENLNFNNDLSVIHKEEQLFTGYDIKEFEELFMPKPVQWITTVGVDSILEIAEARTDFGITNDDFPKFINWHLSIGEKRELLGSNNHLLYICRKNED